MQGMSSISRTVVFSLIALCPAAGQMAQNPSPKVENTRAHRRLPKSTVEGRRWKMPVGDLLLTKQAQRRKKLPLIIHFQGQPWVAEYCAARRKKGAAILTAYLGAGSARYARPFQDPESFPRLLEAAATARGESDRMEFDPIVLSGFSAGYGAIREILKVPSNWDRVDAIVLVDAIHTGYRGGTKPGAIETEKLDTFLRFARLAVAEKKQMLVTHSEIFPGTFASTTETADYLLSELGIPRRPVLKWGPLGMQQLSHARKGRFELLGFAGNSAPDHMDHYHALESWLRKIRM